MATATCAPDVSPRGRLREMTDRLFSRKSGAAVRRPREIVQSCLTTMVFSTEKSLRAANRGRQDVHHIVIMGINPGVVDENSGRSSEVFVASHFSVCSRFIQGDGLRIDDPQR